MDLKIAWFVIGGGSVGTLFKEIGKRFNNHASLYTFLPLGSFMLRDGILEMNLKKK